MKCIIVLILFLVYSTYSTGTMVIYYIDKQQIVVGIDSKAVDDSGKTVSDTYCKIHQVGNFFVTTAGRLFFINEKVNWDILNDLTLSLKVSNLNLIDQFKLFEDFELKRSNKLVKELKDTAKTNIIFSVGISGFTKESHPFICIYDFMRTRLSNNEDSVYFNRTLNKYTDESNDLFEHVFYRGSEKGVQSISKNIKSFFFNIPEDEVPGIIDFLLTITSNADPDKIGKPFDLLKIEDKKYNWIRQKPECR